MAAFLGFGKKKKQMPMMAGPHTLRIELLEFTGVRNVQPVGMQDPYVTFLINGVSGMFNETITLMLNASTDRLELVMKDKSFASLGSATKYLEKVKDLKKYVKDNKIGEAIIPLGECLSGAPMDRAFNLNTGGTLHIRAQITNLGPGGGYAAPGAYAGGYPQATGLPMPMSGATGGGYPTMPGAGMPGGGYPPPSMVGGKAAAGGMSMGGGPAYVGGGGGGYPPASASMPASSGGGAYPAAAAAAPGAYYAPPAGGGGYPPAATAGGGYYPPPGGSGGGGYPGGGYPGGGYPSGEAPGSMPSAYASGGGAMRMDGTAAKGMPGGAPPAGMPRYTPA